MMSAHVHPGMILLVCDLFRRRVGGKTPANECRECEERSGRLLIKAPVCSDLTNLTGDNWSLSIFMTVGLETPDGH